MTPSDMEAIRAADPALYEALSEVRLRLAAGEALLQQVHERLRMLLGRARLIQEHNDALINELGVILYGPQVQEQRDTDDGC